jgi:hypothetical protein
MDADLRQLTGLWHPPLVFCSRALKEIVVWRPHQPLWKINMACSSGNSVEPRKAAFSLSSNNEPSSTFDQTASAMVWLGGPDCPVRASTFLALLG